jgi:hypothetical protein
MMAEKASAVAEAKFNSAGSKAAGEFLSMARFLSG